FNKRSVISLETSTGGVREAAYINSKIRLQREWVMLVSGQLTNRILVDAQRLRKESLELRHDCRNTRSISLLLRNLLQEERKSRPSGPHGIFFDPKNPPKGTASVIIKTNLHGTRKTARRRSPIPLTGYSLI